MRKFIIRFLMKLSKKILLFCFNFCEKDKDTFIVGNNELLRALDFVHIIDANELIFPDKFGLLNSNDISRSDQKKLIERIGSSKNIIKDEELASLFRPISEDDIHYFGSKPGKKI